VALKFATRIAISSRSFASRSCRSVMPTPLIRDPRPMVLAIGAPMRKSRCRIVAAHLRCKSCASSRDAGCAPATQHDAR
jgi:hypothetical protein